MLEWLADELWVEEREPLVDDYDIVVTQKQFSSCCQALRNTLHTLSFPLTMTEPANVKMKAASDAPGSRPRRLHIRIVNGEWSGSPNAIRFLSLGECFVSCKDAPRNRVYVILNLLRTFFF